MKPTKTAIIVSLYRRPEYARRCLEALAKCKGIEKFEVFVFVDGPRGEYDRDFVGQTRAVAKSFVQTNFIHLNSIAISMSENFGIDKSKLQYVNQIFDYPGINYDSFIHIEDDIILSPDALQYLSWALEHYKNDPSVLSVSAYQNVGEEYAQDYNNHHRVLRQPHFDCWGWATWRNRWLDVMGSQGQEYSYFCGRIAPGQGLNGWFDHFWESERKRLDKVVIHPQISRCLNLVGLEGENKGTNADDPQAGTNQNHYAWNGESGEWHE